MGCTCYKKHIKTRSSKVSTISINPPMSVSIFRRKSEASFKSEYELIKSLGSGAYSEVFLAYHKKTKSHRAVKTIRKSRLSDQQIDNIFSLKEFTILRELDHPNIVKCYEVLENSNLYFMATEYCPKGSLFSQLSKIRKLTEIQISDIIYQLLSALAYCHEKKVTHRDLKPENILLADDSAGIRVKICDFGSSVKLITSKNISGCLGTAYYIAPEVLSGSYNEKCDIWSIGIIMYILLTGRKPYLGNSSREVIQEIKLHPFQVKKKHMAGFSLLSIDLLKKLLKIDPKKRVSAKQALKHSWIAEVTLENRKISEVIIGDLIKFHNDSMISKAVYLFITTQIYTDRDMEDYIRLFKNIDKDGNGKLDKKELINEFSKHFNSSELEKMASDLIKEMDLDFDGMINYSEFLTKCNQNYRSVSLQDLESAFQMFDIDKSGTISVEEIRHMLQTEGYENNYFWERFIMEADINGDGVIDLKEFISLMQSSLVENTTNYLRKHY